MRSVPRSLIASALAPCAALVALSAGCSGSDAVGAPGGREPVLSSLQLAPASYELFTTPPLNAVQLSLVAKDQHGQIMPEGARFFSSDNPDVAAVDDTGFVIARAPGMARVTATVTMRGVTKAGTMSITVTQGPLVEQSAGRIAFIRRGPYVQGEISGTGGIFIVNADGSDLRQLTTSGDAQPVWSPDGSHLAFVHYQSDAASPPHFRQYLCVSGNEHSEPNCMAVSMLGRPAWSPDGRELAFIGRVQEGARLAVLLTDLEYATVIAKLDAMSDCYGSSDIAWSAAVDRIAFTFCNEIYTIGPDRLGPKFLARVVPSNFHPVGVAWSPDGRSLAVASAQTDCWDDCESQLARLDLNGTHFEVLEHSGLWIGAPVWSPDGARIAYEHGSCSGACAFDVVFTMADGSAMGRLVNDARSPTWRP